MTQTTATAHEAGQGPVLAGVEAEQAIPFSIASMAEFIAGNLRQLQRDPPQEPRLVTPNELGLARDSFWKGENLTTGDHISDCLAVWYGDGLDDKITATFCDLDSRVRASVGQLAMVVLRREERGRHGSIVGVQYQVGRLIGDVGLYMELRGAQTKLPTQESYRVVTLPSGKAGLAEVPSSHPMIVHQMLDLASGQHDPVLSFNPVDLVNHQEVPTIDPDCTDPPACIDLDHVLEAQKPPLQIIIGTELVKGFLETDLALQRHGDAMGIRVASILLRNFK